MSSSRRTWLIVAPSAVLVLAAVGWSVLWVVARDRVGAEIDTALAREAAAGRHISCAERAITGYPFRIEVSCRQPALLQSRGQPLAVTAASIVAVAQLWNPRHVIFDVTGPLRIAEPGPGGAETAVANWTTGRVSFVHDSTGRHRLSVALDNAELRTPAAAAPYRSTRAELHLRRREATGVAGHPLDIAARFAGLEGPLTLPGIRGAVDVDTEFSVSALDIVRGASFAERLRSWSLAGGRTDIVRLRLISDGAAADGTGQFGLDARGRLDGAVRLLIHGLDLVIGDLVQKRLVPREMMTVVPTLAALGPRADIAGRPAMSLPVQLREGLVRIGPLPIGAIPPLF